MSQNAPPPASNRIKNPPPKGLTRPGQNLKKTTNKQNIKSYFQVGSPVKCKRSNLFMKNESENGVISRIEDKPYLNHKPSQAECSPELKLNEGQDAMPKRADEDCGDFRGVQKGQK